MRLSDLDLRELLDFSPRGGIIRFAGQRAVILDTVVLGLLRKEIMQTVGQTAARGILTRLGFAHGWRTAQTLRTAIPWESEREWRIAGGRLHMLQGLVVFDPGDADDVDTSDPFARAIWHESYEAEQHLLNLGKATQPVCWTLSGFVSGYLSFSNNQEIYCVETRCQGCGDECCSFVARSREQWGQGIEEHLPFYRSDCLNSSLEEIARALKKAESQLELRREELRVAAPDELEDPSGLIARSEGMRRVVELARRVAKVDSTVLVTGESGVGKERVARLIHDQSQRAAGPFVAVNCGAVTETLLESELFGHSRGAFSGATQDRAGLFEAAAGGTLFLDEIGEVSPAMQVKLLRVLQEKEIRRVGENRSRPVDARIIAATNRELPEEVSAGRFRSDLFYRLRVIEIRIPPLRDRRDDILPLARALTARTARRLGLSVAGFTPAAADRLSRHRWPGNVRELENAVERAVVLAEHARFDVGDLPEEVRSQPPERAPIGADTPLEEVEKAHILAVLRAHGGNRARAAEALQIGLATLYRKLKSYESAPG
jgi:DNA-binding NtrC family response regulator